MNDCIFCKIIAGEIPSVKVYEDDDVIAFMDISPVIHGHTLVLPKAHVPNLLEAPDDVLAKVFSVAKRIANAQMKAFHADGVNIHQTNGAAAGQSVFHLHVHVIPRYNDDGHSWNWSPRPYASPDEPARLAQAIRDAL